MYNKMPISALKLTDPVEKTDASLVSHPGVFLPAVVQLEIPRSWVQFPGNA